MPTQKTTLYRFHPDKTVDKFELALGESARLMFPADGGHTPMLNRETVILTAQIGAAFATLAQADPAEAGVRIALISALIEKGDADGLIAMTGNTLNIDPPDTA